MDNIDISFGDDILISQEPGVNVDEQNNVDVVSDTIGIPGEKGEPGFSPIANVTQTDNGAIISITDETGTTTATVLNGEDGVSPSASVTQTASGAVIEITDANGTTTANVSDGEPGSDGQNATIAIGSVTSLSYGSTPTVTNTGTATNAVLNWGIPEGQRGEQGIQGEPGINAQAYVTQNTGSATITIEDADGTTTATVYDGQNGTNGQDGYSPSATVTQTASGATISITDINGTTTANVNNGVNGTNGVDGFSPTATVTQNTGSATISITDQNGTTTATVNDGTNGVNGVTPTITATASVDNTTGTPTVNVSKTGTDTNPSFAFAFEHLKGQQGESGKGFVDYSASEVDTGLKWTDGSTIYRRVFSGTVSITGNNVATVSTGVSAKSIINAYGYFDSWHSGNNYNRVAFGQYNGTNIFSSALIRNASTIELQFISSINVSSPYAVVVEYIK